MLEQDTQQILNSQTRNVSENQKSILKSKLECLKDKIKLARCGFKPVTSGTVFIEFDDIQISQILLHCESIFSVKDVFKVAEIWRYKHAKEILSILHEVFGDIDIQFDEIDFNEEDFEDMELVHDDWNQLQEENSFTSVTSTIMDEQMDQTLEQSDMSDVEHMNESDIIAHATSKITNSTYHC